MESCKERIKCTLKQQNRCRIIRRSNKTIHKPLFKTQNSSAFQELHFFYVLLSPYNDLIQRPQEVFLSEVTPYNCKKVDNHMGFKWCISHNSDIGSPVISPSTLQRLSHAVRKGKWNTYASAKCIALDQPVQSAQVDLGQIFSLLVTSPSVQRPLYFINKLTLVFT